MNISGKYLKDENGNIISPITSFNTIYSPNSANLNNCIGGVSLFDGNNLGNLTLSDSCLNYDKFSIRYEFSGVTGYVLCRDVQHKEISLVLGITFSQYKLARFVYKNIDFTDKQVTVKKSGYFGITEGNTTEANSNDANGIHIRTIIGYKK